MAASQGQAPADSPVTGPGQPPALPAQDPSGPATELQPGWSTLSPWQPDRSSSTSRPGCLLRRGYVPQGLRGRALGAPKPGLPSSVDTNYLRQFREQKLRDGQWLRAKGRDAEQRANVPAQRPSHGAGARAQSARSVREAQTRAGTSAPGPAGAGVHPPPRSRPPPASPGAA